MDARPSSQPRVTFRTPDEEPRPPQVHHPGKLTVRYDRRDLQRRLDTEQWAETQLQLLFDCDQEDKQTLEINIDELLDLSDSEQRSRLNTILRLCQKPTKDFINSLMDRIKGLHKSPTQQRK